MRVGELSRRTGVGVSTLRAWERRFGLLEPERSESGQRLYSETDVERVAAVGRLLAEGLTVSAAASRVAASGPGTLSATQREAFLLHQAVQAAGEGIWVSQEGLTRIANRRMAELLRCSLDDLMDRPVMEFVDPAWLDVATHRIESLRDGRHQRFQLGLLRRDGTSFLADVNATPLRDNAGNYNGAVAVLTDATARAEAAADEHFRVVALDAIGDAVVATQTDGTISYANAAAERLLGWRASELAGQNALNLLPAPAATVDVPHVHAQLLARRQQSGEMMLTRRDGTQFPARITGSPILDDDGELVGLIGVMRDDGERHRLEAEVLGHEQQAEMIAVLGTQVLTNGAQDGALVVQEAIDSCRRVLEGDLAAYLEVGEPGEDLNVRVTSPHRPEAGPTPAGSRSIAGYTALAGKAVVVMDASRDRRFDLPPPPSWRGPIRSAVAAPVHGPEGVRGVVLVGGFGRHAFSASSAHFVQSVANVVGMALQYVD